MARKCVRFFTALGFMALGLSLCAQTRVGVVFSGSGMMDGTELSEGVLTMLYLEQGGAKAVYMAPNLPQADVIDHKAGSAQEGTRNALVESARISRGNIKDMAAVKSSDMDAIVIVGGLGSIKTLSNFMAKGADCTVNADLTRLVQAMRAEGKPIGSMCAASVMLPKMLPGKGVKVTIGKGSGGWVQAIAAMGGTHEESAVGDIAFDSANSIVSTPAMMLGPSTADIAPGIEKMVKKVLEMAKAK
jgi:enhancing lycopene biosynthesis protein 2